MSNNKDCDHIIEIDAGVIIRDTAKVFEFNFCPKCGQDLRGEG